VAYFKVLFCYLSGQPQESDEDSHTDGYVAEMSTRTYPIQSRSHSLYTGTFNRIVLETDWPEVPIPYETGFALEPCLFCPYRESNGCNHFEILMAPGQCSGRY